MADYMWFVPVSGGRGFNMSAMAPSCRTPIEPYNVQWDFDKYPDAAAKACNDAGVSTTMTMGSSTGPTQSKLSLCYGMWNWRSCSDGQNVTVGGQLAVGTVFSRLLNLYADGAPPALAGSLTWDRVDVWVKFMLVSANINKFDNVFFVINDTGANSIGLGAPPRNWLVPVPPPPSPIAINTWFVAHAFKTGNWDDPLWDSDNLRATLSVQGTSVAANVGAVGVNVEWFAFKLSNPDE